MNLTDATRISGAIVVDKPIGLSSSQVVSRVKWALIRTSAVPKNFKIGHGGTLDPFASGVLIVLLGEATKLSDCYLHSKKTYTGRIRLGVRTDSGDPTGREVEQKPVPKGAASLSPEFWQNHADAFVKGPYHQTPPMHSAKKKDGVALYELARRGISIERPPILKRIEGFRVTPLSEETLAFETTCESGTYIRVLAEDLAARAETVAHLETLRRTRSSDRDLSEAAPLDTIETHLRSGLPVKDLPAFIPLMGLASHVPALAVSPTTASALRTGLQGPIQTLLKQADSIEDSGRYCLARLQEVPIALLERSTSGAPFRLQRVIHS